MPHWLLKSALHRVVSLLPNPHWWNEQIQTRFLKSLDFGPEQLRARLAHCRKFLDHFLRHRPDCADGFSAVELGTGWYPFLPIGLWLCGASEVWTYDIASLLKPARVQNLMKLLGDFAESGELARLLPRSRPERMAQLRSAIADAERVDPAELLARFNIRIHVRDAKQTGLPPQSADFFCSYSVLEYIPRPVLVSLHREFARVARPGAVAVHFIHLDDEYAKFDQKLSPFHFLKFTEAQWRWLRSALNPLTRLRISDYREAITEAGFAIVEEENSMGDIEGLPLAPEFQRYSREDLAVLESWLVAQVSA